MNTPIPPDINVTLDMIFKAAPSTVLSGQDSTSTKGIAWMGIYDKKSYVRIAALNLPNPPTNSHYDAWLIEHRYPGEAIPIGPLEYSSSTKQAKIFYTEDRDLSAFKTIRITLEPETKLILEGSFATDADLQITNKVINKYLEEQKAQKSKQQNELLKKLLNEKRGGENIALPDITKKLNNQNIKLPPLNGNNIPPDISNLTLDELLSKIKNKK